MMNTPADLQACLIQDVHQLLLHAPSTLMRVPTSLYWGLAPQTIGTSIWYAISVAGCARIAVRKRPWVYRRGVPDLIGLAATLAARFKHAEPKDRVGQYLFALDDSAGPCGKSCILAHATEENFPWILGGSKPVPTSEEPVVDPHEWARLCYLTMDDHQALVVGGSLPAPADLKSLLQVSLRGFMLGSLATTEGRARVKALLVEDMGRERRRLEILARSWVSPSQNPYVVPSWLDEGVVDSQLDEFLSGWAVDMTHADPSSSFRHPTHEAPEPPMPLEKPRRPTVVPAIQPPRPLTGRFDDHSPDRV